MNSLYGLCTAEKYLSAKHENTKRYLHEQIKNVLLQNQDIG